MGNNSDFYFYNVFNEQTLITSKSSFSVLKAKRPQKLSLMFQIQLPMKQKIHQKMRIRKQPAILKV